MTFPSNVRSLFAFGVFWTVGGAWLTLVTGVRTWPLRGDTNVAFAAPSPANDSSRLLSTPIENTRSSSDDRPNASCR